MRIGKLQFHLEDPGQGPALTWGHGLTASMAGQDALGLFGWHDFPRIQRLMRHDARDHVWIRGSHDVAAWPGQIQAFVREVTS